MNTKKPVLQTVHTAEVDRAFSTVAKAWEESSITVDEMCEHLDAINDVMLGITSFAEFTESTGLKCTETLN